MKVLVLQLLSTASGVNSDILWGKIHFSMTDSTSHNMEVDEKVAEKPGSDHVPGHLLCHVHPACMFTRRVQELCKEVDATIGPDKIFSSFAVSLSEVQVSVVEQWMDCLTRLVTHDFDHKAWNYADEFDIFILPLKNLAKRLQRESVSIALCRPLLLYCGLISMCRTSSVVLPTSPITLPVL